VNEFKRYLIIKYMKNEYKDNEKIKKICMKITGIYPKDYNPFRSLDGLLLKIIKNEINEVKYDIRLNRIIDIQDDEYNIMEEYIKLYTNINDAIKKYSEELIEYINCPEIFNAINAKDEYIACINEELKPEIIEDRYNHDKNICKYGSECEFLKDKIDEKTEHMEYILSKRDKIELYCWVYSQILHDICNINNMNDVNDIIIKYEINDAKSYKINTTHIKRLTYIANELFTATAYVDKKYDVRYATYMKNVNEICDKCIKLYYNYKYDENRLYDIKKCAKVLLEFIE
jgi:hypothetical protein